MLIRVKRISKGNKQSVKNNTCLIHFWKKETARISNCMFILNVRGVKMDGKRTNSSNQTKIKTEERSSI